MIKKTLCLMTLISVSAFAAEWDDLVVPADAGEGMMWELQESLSDDFNYSAPAVGKSDEFDERWEEGFINPWKGPGLSIFTAENSKVKNNLLQLHASKASSTKDGHSQYHTGAIHSKESVIYPVYVEASMKITDLTLANGFWMLSKDSTQEIDILESYGSSRANQNWYDKRIHLSHHVFIREPFKDYQPKDAGTWHTDSRFPTWRGEFHRVGVYWKGPWHLEYYINGEHVRTIKTKNGEIIDGKAIDGIDPDGIDYTDGKGLSKEMEIIFDIEQQDWRYEDEAKTIPLVPTDAELADSNKNTFSVEWVRVYKPVEAPVVEDPVVEDPVVEAPAESSSSGGGSTSIFTLMFLALLVNLRVLRK